MVPREAPTKLVAWAGLGWARPVLANRGVETAWVCRPM